MKNIRYFKIYIALFICFIIIVSCSNFLDVEPKTSISNKAFFKTANDLKLANNALYIYVLPGHLYSVDLWSDDSYARSPNRISSASRVAVGTDTYWNGCFNTLWDINNIIEHGSVVQGIESEINRYVGEARFFRAMIYFELVRRYGDVPWINKTLNVGDNLIYGPRIDRKIITDSILQDLDFAATWLPTPSQISSVDWGRISKTAALALKSRVALFEGTRQKYHKVSGGDPSKYFKAAQDASLEVIKSGEHTLYRGKGDDSYRQLFLLVGNQRKVSEKILVRMYGENASNNLIYSNLSRLLEQAQMTPTQALVDAYLCTDGLPIDKTKTAYNEKESVDAVFAFRDPRLSMTVFRKGDPYKGGDVSYDPPNSAASITGYHQKKYYDVAAWTPNQNFQDLILIRYAEVLLNYAEATYELNGSISNNDLDLTINDLRDRVKFTVKLTNEFVTSNGLDMLEEIRRERRVELACEGFRYFDLIRWKTAEIELIKPVLGRLNFSENIAGKRKVAQTAVSRKFSADRDYLFPLPTLQLDLLRKDDTDPDKTWVQNPNWEN